MPHDVFISYSNVDKQAAFAACATFEANGIRCWIAPRDVAAGSEWAEEIITAIESAKIMVLIFSSNSNESRQVKREIELAVSRGLTIMPLRLEQVEPTRSMAYYMAGVHWIDALTPPLENHFKRMVDWIKPHLTGGPAPEMPPRAAEPAPAAKTREPPDKKPGFRWPWEKGETAPKPAPTQPDSAMSELFDSMFTGNKPPRDAGSIGSKTGLLLVDLSAMFQTGLKAARENRHKDAVTAYRQLIKLFDGDTRPLYIEQVIRAFYNAGNSLQALGRHEEAIASFDDAMRRADGRDEEGIRETSSRILFNRAHSLEKLDRKAEAIAVHDEVIRRFGSDVDGGARKMAGDSMFTKAILLGASKREDEAIRCYEQFLTRFGNDPRQEANAAEAMFNIGAAHGTKGRNSEAVAAYGRTIARFRGAKEPDVNEFVAKALYNMGNRLSDLKKAAEAIKAYEEVIASFGNDPRMPERIAKAMINRANQLGVMGRRKDANAGYDAVIAKFASSSSAEVQQQVTNARNFKT
jgi:tetratricopeptide (TPR) repeat protein